MSTPALPTPHSGGTARSAVVAIPGAVVLGLVLVLAESHGGFAPSVWYPGALTALALLVVLLLMAPPTRSERSRPVEQALVAYGLFCLFSYASTLWADVPGQAWDAANRDLLYGVVLALATARPWSRRAALYALLAVVLGVSGVAVATLISGTHGDPARLFLDGRLSLPLGYANATADFWLIGLWPALWLACDRDLWWPWRGVSLGAAALLLEISLLSQSRGAALAFALTAALFIALIPRRWPALLALAICGAATASSWGALTHTRDVRTSADLGPAFTDARRATVIGVIAALALGLVLALTDRHLLGPWRERRPSLARRGNLLLAALAAGAVVVALAATGDPVGWAQARYHDFKTSGYNQVGNGPSRFTGSLGSNRYDFYRVALDEFASHPLKGVGAENFAVAYLQHGRSAETPVYTHSFGFGTLAGLGVIGGAMFVVFLALALRAVRLAVRGADAGLAGVAIAALTGFAMFFLHGMADWLWEFPALGMLAFALLGLAMRVRATSAEPGSAVEADEGPAGAPAGRVRWRATARRGAVALLTLAVAVSLAFPGIAARLTESAYKVSADDPALAISRLDRAEGLNFLRADAPLAAGVFAQAAGQNAQAARDFRRALAREPRNWFAYLELAIVQANSGARTQALRNMTIARMLDPRQPVLGQVQAQLAAGQRIDPAAVSANLSSQLSSRLKPTG